MIELVKEHLWMSLLGVVVFGLVVWAVASIVGKRRRKAHTSQLGPRGRQAAPQAPEAAAVPPRATLPAAPVTFLWSGRFWLLAVLAVLLVVMLWSAAFTGFWDSLSLAAINTWVRNNWWILLACFALVAAIVAIATSGGVRKGLLWVVVSSAVAVLVLLPFVAWVASLSTKTSDAAVPIATLPMAPYGDTVRMTARAGNVYVFNGSGFTVHCIKDMSIVEEVGPGQKCSAAVDFQYARNIKGVPNEATPLSVPR